MTTEKELGNALKNNQDEIVIEGDLCKKVVKIHATGKPTWIIAFGAITVAIYATISLIPTGGASAPAAAPSELIATTVAATTLGLPAAISAVSIGVAAGSAAVLNKLRNYKLTKISEDKIILTKKK